MKKEDKKSKKAETSNLGRQHSKKQKNKKHSKILNIIKIILLLIILLLIIGIGIVIAAVRGDFGDQLKIDKASLVVGDENSTVYDADGNLIATLSGGTKRKSITLEEMSEYLPKAYVAIEDERFYSHNGVDLGRTAYATLTYIFNGGNSSFGGSTITQQVVKNITHEKDNTALAGVIRKIKEISKSIQVERLLSKDEILELYLNLIFVGGDDINGVELGSIYYFDKSAKDLSIAECAYMAGINHSPNLYKPFEDYSSEENPEQKKKEMSDKIKNRTETVLQKMLELGYINDEQCKQAMQEVENGLNFKKGESANITTDVSYHTAAAIEQILDQIQDKNPDMDRSLAEMYLYSGGFKIYTTQKTDIQAILEQELIKDKWVKSTKYIEEDKKTGMKTEVEQYSMPTMVIENHTTGEIVAAATVTGAKGERTTSTKLGYLNFPTQLKKQTGSSMKPISVIAPGLESGTITGATTYYDRPTTWGTGANAWSPKNYDIYRGLLNMRQAIEVSANIPNAKALTNIGLDVSIKFCESVGMPDFSKEGLSLALGGLHEGVSPTHMAGAYSAIANDGVYITPTFYTKVEDSKGNIVFEPNQETKRVMSEQNAYIEQDILTQPVKTGTATYCKIPGMDVGAKTGTTNGDLDRWLCGFTPYYTAACWFGYDHSAKVTGYGTNPAGEIWDNVMTAIHKDLPNAKFEAPEGIITTAVCRASGKLPGPACTDIYNELFTKDTVPTETCEGHGVMTICNDSQMLATSACPNVITMPQYIPKYEVGAVWVTEGGVDAIPTEYCNIHQGFAPGRISAEDQAAFQAATDAAAAGLDAAGQAAAAEAARQRVRAQQMGQ